MTRQRDTGGQRVTEWIGNDGKQKVTERGRQIKSDRIGRT